MILNDINIYNIILSIYMMLYGMYKYYEYQDIPVLSVLLAHPPVHQAEMIQILIT